MYKSLDVWSAIAAGFTYTTILLTVFIIPSIDNIAADQSEHEKLVAHAEANAILPRLESKVDDNSMDIDKIRSDVSWIRGYLEKQN